MLWCLARAFQDQVLGARQVVLAGDGDATFLGDVKRGGEKFLFEEGIRDRSLPGARDQTSPHALHRHRSHPATPQLNVPLVLESLAEAPKAAVHPPCLYCILLIP